jgi:hypothetical protein
MVLLTHINTCLQFQETYSFNTTGSHWNICNTKLVLWNLRFSQQGPQGYSWDVTPCSSPTFLRTRWTKIHHTRWWQLCKAYEMFLGLNKVPNMAFLGAITSWPHQYQHSFSHKINLQIKLKHATLALSKGPNRADISLPSPENRDYRLALSKGPNRADVSLPSPENRYYKLALSKGPNRVGVSFPSSEDGKEPVSETFSSYL